LDTISICDIVRLSASTSFIAICMCLCMDVAGVTVFTWLVMEVYGACAQVFPSHPHDAYGS